MKAYSFEGQAIIEHAEYIRAENKLKIIQLLQISKSCLLRGDFASRDHIIKAYDLINES